jgi:hypothetical protein
MHLRLACYLADDCYCWRLRPRLTFRSSLFHNERTVVGFAGRLTKLTLAFSAGWLWLALLLAAVIAVDASRPVVGGFLALAAVFSFGSSAVLSFVHATFVRVSALAGLALGLVVASAFAPVTVPEGDPYTEIGFGYPFRFVLADLSYGGGHEPLPLPTIENWNPWEHPALLDALRFLLSYLTVFAGLAVLSLGLRAVWRRIGRRPST